MTWHHAYNGIPTVPRSTGHFFGEHTPSGHDQLSPDTLSGEIEVSIKAASRTVPGQRTVDGRVVVASRSGDPEGARSWEDVTIPVTTLKGVLSSAYEAVTASRMRVFADHDRVLTHRRTTQESTTLYPVFLVRGGGAADSETGLRARVMLGMNDVPGRRGWNRPTHVCAAVLPNSPASATALYDSTGTWMYSGSTKGKKCRYAEGVTSRDVENRLADLRRATPHLAKISFTVQTEAFYKTQRAVVEAVGTERFCGTKDRKIDQNGPYEGYIVRLTPQGSDPLIDTKLNEFVFFNKKKNHISLPVSEDILDRLVEVIHSYLENIRQLMDREKAGTPRNTNTRKSTDSKTWLIHEIDNGKINKHGQILGASDPKVHTGKDSAVMADRVQIKQFLLKLASKGPGIPLFASVSNKGNITGLTPSQVGRRVAPGSVSPAALAEKTGVSPARTYDEASAGDRMWGFVTDKKQPGTDQAAAVRGRITIRPVTPEPLPPGRTWLRLPEEGYSGWFVPTLASPKPSTGVPYLRGKQGEPLPEATTRAGTYQFGQSLIRKVYPTHRGLLGRDDDLPNSTPLHADVGPHDTVVGSYLLPGATFSTSIRFEGITREELAVLLWLLTPERLVPAGASLNDQSMRRGYHRLGFGKPLGLGSVEIRATDVRMNTGEEFAQLYTELSGCLGSMPIDTATTPFARLADALDTLPDGFESTLPVRSFVRAAYGWDDAAPVQYPDADKPADKKTGVSATTNWFKNREENRVKQSIPDNKHALAHTYDLPGLLAPDSAPKG
ncbi:hypothetical protein [Actinomyces procaprae]|uniref:hypothetical protein n=1 Tax=Actinomyces procaprae TaxID=2560010 RepID=UPI0010A26446|nr:hypothetical protein [Actinomyces procaprae]